MTKKEMALEIASALFGSPVTEENWKVVDLMKRNKADLTSHYDFWKSCITIYKKNN